MNWLYTSFSELDVIVAGRCIIADMTIILGSGEEIQGMLSSFHQFWCDSEDRDLDRIISAH